MGSGPPHAGLSTIQVLIATFITTLQSERGLSENTVAAYERDLAQLAKWIGEKCEWTGSDVTDYLGRLSAQSIAPRTLARKTSVIRTFMRFLVSEGEDRGSVVFPTPQLGRSLPKTLSKTTVAAILDAPAVTDDPLREGALLALAYGGGLRASEMCDVRAKDFSASTGVIRVRGKGGRERWVPLPATAVASIVAYLGARNGQGDDPLILGRGGQSVSRQWVYGLLKTKAKSVGIDPVSPHMLRHSYATHLLEGGASLREVQELLGHQNIVTTQIYTSVARSHIRDVYDGAFPR